MDFCKKKQKKVKPRYFKNYEPGDAYCYLDIKRESDFFVAFSVGKWIQSVCDEFYALVEKRTQQPTYKNKISFCSDGNDQNPNAILKHFNKDCVNYGQVIKEKIKQKIVGTHTRKVFGNIPFDQIAITRVDGFCSKLRARIGCLVRKTRNFVKERRQIRDLLHIMQTYHNFIEVKKGKTPAMLERLVKKPLTWIDTFNVRIPIKI